MTEPEQNDQPPYKIIVRSITVTTSFEGIHNWPDAPEAVDFLRNPHRHVFGVKVTTDVRHNDRDLEFFMFRSTINNLIKELRASNDTSTWSCEKYAEDIASGLSLLYQKDFTVEVNEDNENSATVFVCYINH